MPVLNLERLHGDDAELLELVDTLATLPPGLVLSSGQATSGKTTVLLALVLRLAGAAPVTLLSSNTSDFAPFVPLPPHWTLVRVGESEAEWAAAIEGQPADARLVLYLQKDNAPAALRAAARRWVFASVDSPLVGLDVAYALREMFVTYEDFLATVRCVWSQMLLEGLCPSCSAVVPVDARDLEDVFPRGAAPTQLKAAAGCPACEGRGTGGRVAVCEVIALDPSRPEAARRTVLEAEPYDAPTLHWRLHDHARRLLSGGAIGLATYRDLVRRNPLLRAQNRLEQEQAHSHRLGEMFEKFVSPEVRRRLMDSASLQTVVQGQIREVTCLFCDIRGFTSRAEACPPERLFRELNAYFAEVVDAVLATQGTIDKFIGDAVMVVFGAPLEQQDHAERALSCALAIRSRIEDFNRRKSSDLPIEIGIGLNSGPAAAGCVGTDRRMEYTVLGDTVNVAARLESRAGPGQVLLTADTLALAGPRFRTRAFGALRLKGKAQDVECHELLGMEP